LDQRILLPVFLCMILIFLLIAKKTLCVFNKTVKIVLYSFVAVFLLAQLNNLKQILPNYINYGIGYSSIIWTQSKTIDYIKNLPGQPVIYSNGPDIINLFLDRASLMIPNRVNPVDRLDNRDFSEQFQAMVENIKSKNGYLVYFVYVDWRWYLPPLPMVAELLPEFNIYQTEDGFIFSPPKP
jgi:hypothetical protein